MRRFALASIITATALLATGCTSTPEPASSSAPSATPTPSVTSTPRSTPTPSPSAEPEFTAEQLRDICLDFNGNRAVLNPQGPNEVRTALRNDGTWFIEMSGDSPGNPAVQSFTSCVIGGTPDAPEPIAGGTSSESTPDPNYVDGLDHGNSI